VLEDVIHAEILKAITVTSVQSMYTWSWTD